MSGLSMLLVPILTCLCFAVVVAAVAGVIYFLVRRSADDLNRTWGDLGMSTGLTLKPGGVFSQPELNGQYRQRPARLYTYNAGSQGHRTTYTAAALTVNNPSGSILELTPSGTVGNFFGKMLNAQDVQIGNAPFDTRFVVKSTPPEFAPAFLGAPRIQNGILQLPGEFRIEVNGPSVTYAKRGLEESPEVLTKVLNVLSDLADQLEGK